MTLLDDIQWPDTKFDLKEHLILAARVGSHSHGTYVPSTNPDSIDDQDIMGIILPPKRYYTGFGFFQHATSIKGEWDVTLYEFRHLIKMLMKQNPNVLGLLWLANEDYLHLNSLGRHLIKNRNLFRHRQRAYDAFVGYAKAQLKKMTSVNKCLGYMGAKRRELVKRYGYDTKNAAHLVRLLNMGIEYLATGELHVRRDHDREMIMTIKSGGWPLKRVQEYAEPKFKVMEETLKHSPIPAELDEEAIEALVMKAITSRVTAWRR